MELSTVDRLGILRWTGNYWKILEISGKFWKLLRHVETFSDFIVVGCGGVKCKVKIEPLAFGIPSHLL